MASIRVLPENLVNKIAAGEVVERPASVVKELLENAMDAGARHVRIEVEDGGKRCIRVLDDGDGIPMEELPLACLPHATSKIDSLDDLVGVRTLGFRGEALSSIGAVSGMRILTRPREASEGSEIMVMGGKIQPPRVAACPRGTMVEVRDLFYNVPARSKFLRRASTEFRVVSERVTALALASPEVGVELRRDDKRVLHIPPAPDATARIAALVGTSVRKGLRPVKGSAPGLLLFGFVSAPDESRSDARSQHLILCGRPVKDRTVRHALTEAYHTYLMKGRHPLAFLYLDTEPGEVDFNVHPTKAEVRFRDSNTVHTLVVDAVREALETAPPPAKLQIPERPETPVAEAAPLWTGQEAGSPPSPVLEGPRRFLQVHNTYVIEETKEGVRILDQHALHERILLHRLRARFRRGEVESQGALVPPTFPLSAGELAVAVDRRAQLQRIGYAVEPFGEAELIVRSYPAILEGADHEEILHDVLRQLETKGTGAVEEDLLDGLLRQMACRGAVKAGMRLRDDEIAELLDQEREVTGSFACAHGRPTSLLLSLSDLERQFGRK